MSKKKKMPSRKVGGVYSPNMEAVLLSAIEFQINVLEDDLKEIHLDDMEKHSISEDINTLLYYKEKTKKKIKKSFDLDGFIDLHQRFSDTQDCFLAELDNLNTTLLTLSTEEDNILRKDDRFKKLDFNIYNKSEEIIQKIHTNNEE